jgi:N-formylglutamate amidohydrolase
VAALSALSEVERLREEDPFTEFLAEAAPTRIIALRSRFECDLNRARNKSVYLKPEDAWGLNLWHTTPTAAMLAETLSNYDQFYATVRALLRHLAKLHGGVVVFDIHSYNHRRDGADAPMADVQANPDVNIGTGSMDRRLWEPVVERFMADLRMCEYADRRLDVRENVRFLGGRFSSKLHESFPGVVCAIAIEFKKTFMDEWTGEVDQRRLDELGAAMRSTIPGVLESLESMKRQGTIGGEHHAPR